MDSLREWDEEACLISFQCEPLVLKKVHIDSIRKWSIGELKSVYNNPRDIEDILRLYILHSSREDRRAWLTHKAEKLQAQLSRCNEPIPDYPDLINFGPWD